MKKNKMMRLASVLLVAVLLSTCAISGTFAKYVTSDAKTSTAKVAKFGVTVAASSDLFGAKYAVKEDTDKTAISYDYSVESSNKKDTLVAPGTEGSLTKVKITGTPEVAVRVTNEANVDLGENWKVEDTYYCPLVITVGGTSYYGMNYTSVDNFETAVKTAIDNTKIEYAPNTNLATEYPDYALSISWKWDFEKGVVADLNDKNDNLMDTALGNAAAEGTGVEISISVTTTVTQID